MCIRDSPDSYPAHDGWIIRMAEGVGGKLVHEEVLQCYRRHGANESQSFANNLAKVTKKDVLSSRLRLVIDLFRVEDVQRHEEQLSHAAVFLQGVDEAVVRCGENCKEWIKYREEVRGYVEALKARRQIQRSSPVSYTHLRAHETVLD